MRPLFRGLTTAMFMTLAVATSGCDGFDLSGCLDGCFDDCLADCGACDCTDCECACEGCAILPIPGGFPADQRIPNATQVRLSPAGIEFLEQNAESLIAPLLGDIAPGSTIDDIRVAIPPIQASVFDGSVLSGFAGVCMNNTAVASSTANGSTFSGGSANSSPFTINEATALIASVGNSCTSRSVTLQQNVGGSWVNRCSADATFLVGGFNEPTCGYDAQPGTYRVRTTVGAGGVVCGFDPSVTGRVYRGDNGNCQVSLDLRDLDISAIDATPDRLRIDVGVFARAVNSAGQPRNLPIRGWGVIPDCSIGINTTPGTSDTIDFRAELAITEQTTGSRAGYGQFELLQARFINSGFESEDIALSCSGAAGAILTLFDGIILGTIEMTIEGLVNEGDLIQQFADLKQPAAADPTNNNERTLCPDGAVARPSDAICVEDTNGNGQHDSGENTEVPLLLGLEGRLDMGDFLSAISPGLRAAVDIIAAVDGEATASDVDTSNNGANDEALGYTINLFGGFNSLVSSCVTDLENPPALPDIAAADAFNGGEGDANHVALGLSEEVMNYGTYQLWRSGALCLQVTTRLDQLLSTGLFSVLIGSLKDLAFPNSGAALGMALRPAAPPVITLGAGTEDDPFITVSFPALSIDFYVWSTERYVRFMTFTADVIAEVNLPLSNGQITPEIVGVRLENSSVSNNELIREDPARVSAAVEGVVPLALGMLTGAIPQIDINELIPADTLPVGIVLGDDAIRLVESSGERFLGVFVDLAPASGSGFVQRADTSLEIVNVDIPDEGYFGIDSFGEGARPTVEIAMGAEGPEGAEYEYSYRVDRHVWSPWTTSPYAVIDADTFVLQGRHTIQARSRVVGTVGSQDLTPARAEFLLDLQAPFVEAVETSEGNVLRAGDAVSTAENLEYRYRADGDDAWSDWTTLGSPELALADVTGRTEFEVRDEAGNVGSNAQSLRGLPPPSDGGGCSDCSVNGETDPSRPLTGLLALFGLALVLRRRREDVRG